MIIRMSRRNRAENNSRGENLSGDADEPAFTTGASSGATAISPSIFHFLNVALKWVYLITIASTIGRTQNPQVTWAVMGIIVSAHISKFLKVLFNQRRPSTASGIREDPGMPSSHAYTLLYTAVYNAIALIGWKGLNTITFGFGLTIILFGVFMAWSRSLEGVHTPLQVMVGMLLGLTTAIAWYYAWNTVMIRHLYFFNKARIFLHLASFIAVLKL